MKWYLLITRVDNGYILKGSDGYNKVIEEDLDDELAEHENLLFEVRDYFNFFGSKHDPERIWISRKKRED